MPTPSEFEEKEFEQSLELEIGSSTREIWSPGQVLEHHVPVDLLIRAHQQLVTKIGAPWHFGVWLGDPLLWRAWTRQAKRPGQAPPDFRGNLFLQVKRSHLYSSKQPALASPCWKMEIESGQQTTLERLAKSLSNLAVVTYAAPAFNTRKELFDHRRANTLVDNTTFPDCSRLSGHSIWKYDCGGSRGIAHSEPERLEFASLTQRSAEVAYRLPSTVRSTSPESLTEQLVFLWDKVILALQSANQPEHRINDLKYIADHITQTTDNSLEKAYIRVATAAWFIGVIWLVIAPQKDLRQ